MILLSTEEEDSIPNMVLSSESAGLQLPSYVDNSTDTISTGGVAVLAVYETSWKPDTTLPQGSPMAGQKYLYELGTSGPHEITIVGYHDSVHCFDLNGDGEYKNTDLDGDSIIQLDECELGALYIVNSYGETFGNLGYIWLPYKLLAGTGVQGKTALTCLSTDDYSPDLTVKVKVEHELRDYQTFKIGYAEDASKENYTKSTWTRIFKNQGGGLDMRGCYEGPIEVGFDFSYYYGNEDFGKIFLSVTEKDKDEAFYYDGEIKSYSIIDYRWGETFELECDSFNVELLNQAETILSIDYDLIPHESNITSDLTFNSNMVSRFMPTVDNNSTLTVEEGVKVDMYSSEIYIKNGSTLKLEDSAVILAKRGNCKITIDGDIDVGSGVIFEAEDGASLEVVISNINLYSNFTNVTFKKSKLTNFGESLTISNSYFDECPRLYSLKGSVIINNNTVFNKSSVYLSDETSGQSNNVIIQGCTFTRPYQSPPQDYYAAVEVWNYSNFYIENNDISGYNSGIIISQSGGGLTGNQIINNNELSNLNTSGILTFSSTATLWSNYIHDNQFGVRFTNNSNISMHGYSYNSNYDDINNVRDNSSYEVYASELSFPWYFKYNAIIDSNNLGNDYGDPLVYYDTQGGMLPSDAKHNCWGTGFDDDEDLYPDNMLWDPTWCPGDGGEKSSEVALQSYQDGLEYFENEEYEDAKDEFESIIELYPETQYSSAAMKSLFNLEKFNDNDYATLQSYYETNDSIQADSLLTELSIFLANRCEVEMENWQTAIDHYEDVIENTDDPQDSIFAIIDLGYTYLLMDEDESRATFMGKMTEHIPNSIPSFIEKRDYLLSLLPIDKTKEHLPETSGINGNSDILKQNTPNPFNNSTTIYYDLPNKSNVEFKVYDSKGSIVKTIYQSVQKKGLNNFKLDMQQMPKGLYFYSIFTDGNLVGSRKMIVK